MSGLRNRAALIGALTLGSMGAVAVAGVQPAPVARSASTTVKRAAFRAGYVPPDYEWDYRGPGISMAQQKRASHKKRNVKRNRAAHRG